MEVNESNFEEKVIELSKKVPVVVDFWAPWCMPCEILKPVLEKLAKDYDGKFVLAKLNVDSNPNLAKRYGIMSIPNVKLFVNGKIKSEFVGVIPEQAIKEWLDKNI